MIVDCYTHAWDATTQLGRSRHVWRAPASMVPSQAPSENPDANHPTTTKQGIPPEVPGDPGTGFAHHLAASEPVDFTIIAGFKSRYLDAEIANEKIAAYVAAHRDDMIGFAGIDPSDPAQAMDEMRKAHETLSMKGVAVAPAAQDFHPASTQAMLIYAEAAKRSLPVLFHTGIGLCTATRLDYARPLLLDEVARELPDLRIIIAHMGHPWVEETILLLAKHPHVFAETSGLVHRPWQAYHALLSAHQAGVMDKLLFGSGFPSATASHCIEELYSINHLCHGTNLPTIPREQIRSIVERDALSLLGIAKPRLVPVREAVMEE